jgi:hypothetical protein
VGYLEQFARNRRSKEKSEVLTARLPQSLHSDFKKYCDELGLSISEAVCLLVEREMTGVQGASGEVSTTKEYINNDDVVEVNTETDINVVEKKRNVVQKNTKENTRKSNSNTGRFMKKDYEVLGELPCPVCDQWASSSNFARHANRHNMTTEQILTSEEYKDKIQSMIEERKRMSESEG